MMKSYRCIRRVQVSGLGVVHPGAVVQLTEEQEALGHVQTCFTLIGEAVEGTEEAKAVKQAELRTREMLERRLTALHVRIPKLATNEDLKALLDEVLTPHRGGAEKAGVVGPPEPGVLSAGKPVGVPVPPVEPDVPEKVVEPLVELALKGEPAGKGEKEPTGKK